jgi:hypothetical protein
MVKLSISWGFFHSLNARGKLRRKERSNWTETKV